MNCAVKPRDSKNRAASPGEEIDRIALYREFMPLTRRLISQYGSCPQLREELSGEIFCRFCALVDAFDPSRGVPLRAYLVHQLSASVYTFVRSYRRSADREHQLESYADQTRHELHYNPTQDWDHSLFMETARDHVRQSIGKLSDRQKHVVMRRYYEEQSFENIAQDLDVQAVTARSLLRHALNNLRTSFQANQLMLD
jgi:RNA polymerase sigma factor (sigma-70 family)